MACFICRVQWQHLHSVYLFATILIIPDEVPQIQTKSKPHVFIYFADFVDFAHLPLEYHRAYEFLHWSGVYLAPVSFKTIVALEV